MHIKNGENSVFYMLSSIVNCTMYIVNFPLYKI